MSRTNSKSESRPPPEPPPPGPREKRGRDGASGEGAAAPPDDGHEGSFTRPQDTLQRTERGRRHPPLAEDPAPRRSGGKKEDVRPG